MFYKNAVYEIVMDLRKVKHMIYQISRIIKKQRYMRKTFQIVCSLLIRFSSFKIISRIVLANGRLSIF